MKRLLAIAALAALLVAGVAQACRSVHSYRYIVMRDPPARLPEGARLIKVRLLDEVVSGREAMSAGARAHILAGRGAGRIVRLRPAMWTSCSAWFEGERTGYAVGWPQGPRGGPTSFEVVEYRLRKYRTPEEENSVGYKPSAT